ncbi:hypothetical protein [Fodinibius sp.]|uniref:hypothetical protein n=1 Tax=Fodinibius sp. TaxID=1872440 RepID=UPI002ACE09BC|nr:hypothetical protein [Fodinibius sp.]MDZ7660737.1 hypothetical protein [Fodinibius sp.]
MMQELKNNLFNIENKLITISFDYSRKIVDCNCADTNILRDSLKYRNGAINFHLEQIIDYKEWLSDYLDQKDGYSKAMDLKLNPSRKLNYLFDDLIFNLMSFDDYYAVFITYLFYGEEIRSKAQGYNPLSIKNSEFKHLSDIIWKVNWTEFVKLIRPDENSRLKYDPSIIQSSASSEAIIQNDNNFIFHLSKLRNDIIHNKASSVKQGSSFNPNEGASFSFSTPAKFQELFPKVDTSFEDGIKYIIENFSTGVLEISNALLEDIEKNRKVEKGEEFMKYESELEDI